MKNRIIRHLALFASVIILLTSTAQTTFSLIVTKTETLVNTFKPFESVLSDLLITKTVEHPLGDTYVIPDNVAFNFKVELGYLYANTVITTTQGNKTADEKGSFIVSVKPGETFGIEGIDVGTKVKVSEIEKEGSGFTVKNGENMKEVTVSDSGSVSVDFVNIYSPQKVTGENISVNGEKILSGRDWQNGDSFAFLLEQKIGEEWQEVATKTVIYDSQNNDFNKFDFSAPINNLSFERVGDYEFRLTEIAGNLAGVDYDKSVNTFTVKVTDTDMNGSLEILDIKGSENITVKNENGKYEVSVIFNNIFVPSAVPDDTSVDIAVNKTVKNMGADKISPEGFEFVLENKATGEKQSLKSDKEGKAVFNLPITAIDIGKTYEYKLYEVNGGAKGITYDDDVYDITVAVSLNGNKLKTTVTMNGDTVENCVADFINVYYIESANPPITGDKSKTSIWFALMILSAVSCVVLLFLENKMKDKK